MDSQLSFHAVWWVPEGNRRFTAEHHTGTLTYYGNNDSTLEIYFKPVQGTIFRAYENYEVIWGKDSNGVMFTLFNCVMVRNDFSTKAIFEVEFVLIGAFIKSITEPFFDSCVSKFPFLRNWAFDQKLTETGNEDEAIFCLNMRKGEPMAVSELGKGLRTYLWGQISYHFNPFTLNVEQITSFNIDAKDKTSIDVFLQIVREFSQFFSIAVFAPQHPSEVIFKKTNDTISYSLLFKKQLSTEPKFSGLIKYNKLKDKVPSMFIEWHTKHEQIAPIANYLIRSMRYESQFDAPDFLIIAQALDGYFKRFVNNKDGKDIKQYKQQIEKLLKEFKDIDVVKKCKIDADVLTQTRHKYSHLIPDEDKKIAKAVNGQDLFGLTQKCKILLTCCILDMLGLTSDEINLCCNQSPLQFILNSLPIE